MKRLNATISENNTKITNFDSVMNKNMKEHNPKFPENSDLSYKILIIGCLGSGKAN